MLIIGEIVLEELFLKLEHFDGPLSLLLHLIEKNDIDIYDIEISIIVDQFLEYLKIFEKNNMDIASEFVVMAATLLEIKARMLLPNGDESYKDVVLLSDEDPRYELVERLLEYKKFKSAGEELLELYEQFGNRKYKEIKSLVKKEKDKTKFDYVISPAILGELFTELLMKMPMEDETRADFFDTIKRDIISVEEMTEIISNKMIRSKKMSFFQLFNNVKTREELIVGFISVLNLIKDRIIKAIQNEQYGDIDLEYLGDEIVMEAGV